jgi:hypothetical protein
VVLASLIRLEALPASMCMAFHLEPGGPLRPRHRPLLVLANSRRKALQFGG